jgi:two-component system chemotaxis response regulator CheY
LIVSALSDKATAIEALKNGASGFLYKPFTDEELVNALLELIKE